MGRKLLTLEASAPIRVEPCRLLGEAKQRLAAPSHRGFDDVGGPQHASGPPSDV